MVRLVLVILGLMLGVSVGGFIFGFINREIPHTSPSENQASSSAQTVINTLPNTCTNSNYKFTISYPTTWLTTTSGSEGCLTFSLGEDASGQVKINPNLNDQTFAKEKTSLETSDETKLLLNKLQSSSVNGEVYKIELENTGLGDFPKGTRSIYFLVDGPKKIIIAYTETAVSSLRDTHLQLLDGMVRSLQIIN